MRSKKEVKLIKETKELRWKHSDEEVRQFMHSICDDYGLLHRHYATETDSNAYNERWEQLYGQILAANNFVMSTEGVCELFERRIEQAELDRLLEKQRTPKLKGRSRLKQLRLHLNAGITRGGFYTLNSIFKNGHLAMKADPEVTILIDGLTVDLVE